MDIRLKNLKDVMAVQTTSYNVKKMNKYIKDFVKTVPDCKIYKNHGNLYVTRGRADLYPCVVAHTDTVHDIVRDFHVQRHKDVLYAINGKYERVGIGGDDKVGVFVALEILRTTPVCKVAFFRDEEVGCQGSKVADMSFFEDVSLVLQCDRQGYADFVNNIFYTELFPQEFSTAIAPLLEKYGRVESDGGMTDVWQLAENGLKVACANMSCGYYDPHSDNEYIKISEVFATLDFVAEVVNTLGDQKWTITDRGGYYNNYTYGRYSHTHSYRRYGGGAESNSGRLDEWDDWDGHGGTVNKTSTEDSWDEDHKIVGAECTQCADPSASDIAYDDTQGMYWCHGCQDYVREEMIDFSGVDEGIVNAYVSEDPDSSSTDDGLPF